MYKELVGAKWSYVNINSNPWATVNFSVLACILIRLLLVLYGLSVRLSVTGDLGSLKALKNFLVW